MSTHAPDLTGLRPNIRAAVETALDGERLDDAQALALADVRGAEHATLWAAAAAIRDRGHGPWVTYSPKVLSH